MSKKEKGKKFKTIKIILLVIVIAVAVNIFQNLSVGVTTYEIGRGTQNDDCLRILQLSDVHMIQSAEEGERLRKKVSELKPDVIALTGDLVDTSKYLNEEYRKYTIEFCEALCQVAPVYYVYGNHEICLLDDPENNPFKRELETVGVNIHNNKKTIIEKNGVSYNLLGVQDPATLYKNPIYVHKEHKTASIIGDLLAEIDNDYMNIVLAHRPELFEVYTDECNIDLTLTGHAHGGQFRIPFTKICAYAPNQGFLPKYTSGVFENKGNIMIVSRGIGNSVIPIRLFNMPEIVVVDISSHDGR